ncbi:hypothetical protein P4C99_22040 [Pontiellaceae bacterium B1224]|nr:hypothetical protein [Pontiellaceae bacterium B1224]
MTELNLEKIFNSDSPESNSTERNRTDSQEQNKKFRTSEKLKTSDRLENQSESIEEIKEFRSSEKQTNQPKKTKAQPVGGAYGGRRPLIK